MLIVFSVLSTHDVLLYILF